MFTRLGLVETVRVRADTLLLLLTVVVALGFDARTLLFVRAWSLPEAAMSDPVNTAPVTTLTSIRLIFISL